MCFESCQGILYFPVPIPTQAEQIEGGEHLANG